MSCSQCGSVNPCACVETAAIREQGPPGAPGIPGGTPVFQIGTVTSGPSPSVTIVKVNPLLYTLNFVVPSSGTNLANIWTAVQTFNQQAVFQLGINATGASNITDLTLTGDFINQGTGLYVGLQTFTGHAVFNDSIDVTGGITTDTLEVTGDAIFSGATPLGAGECVRGNAYIDSCGKLRYISGPFPNSADGSGAFTTTITPGTTETPVPVNVPFTIPSSCSCGSAVNATITVRGRLDFSPSATVAVTQNSSPPYAVTAGSVNISPYRMQLRLDNPVTGTIIYSSIVSNLDSSRNFLTVQSGVPPGSHTMYVTLQGLGVGTQNLVATLLGLTVEW